MSENAGQQSPIKELSGRIGKYEIVRPLGKGAMGMVYLAYDTILEREVALKVMVAQIADDPELKQRFQREAKAVAKMTHPNVVTVFDLGYHTDGSPYIAMELLKGMDLQKAVRSGPPMSTERKVTILVQVLAGLAHAHQAGIVHRDIKPANIFINQDGSVKIMDFGVARLTTASMTGTGNIVGTADYMSPEQVKGAHVDGRSDVFSVGCMLYELLAGKRPFHSDNLMAIFYKITHDDPNYDLIPGGGEHDALLPILRKALAKELDDRYQTAYDFAVDLRDYLKTHSSTSSGQHALEGLLEMDRPPSTPPQPLTDAPGATVVTGDAPTGATVELGRPTGRTKTPTLGATVRGGATTVLPGTSAGAPTAMGGPAPARAARGTAPTMPRPPLMPRPAPAPAPGHPVLYSVLGGMTVLLIGLGGFIYWKSQQTTGPTPPRPEPSTMVAASLPPATVAVAPPTTVAAPPTTAPPPTIAEATGKSAAALKSAQAAFRQQDYDRAVSQAQAALREEPNNADAQKMLDNALAGQKAQSHFRTADLALSRGDYAAAQSEAEAGRSLAPWDARGPSLLQRTQDAQARAQQQAAARDAQAAADKQQAQQAQQARQVSDFVNKANDALIQKKYDTAIQLFDEALKLDPSNPLATSGKSSAIQARVLSEAAVSAGVGKGATRSFVAGKTSASTGEGRSSGAAPDGFEETAGVTVKKGSQAAELPGKVSFEIEPDQVKPGEKFTIKIYLSNEGSAPISIKDLLVTSTVNSRRSSGALPSLVHDVAPQQKAMVCSIGPDIWKEDTTTWSVEAAVRTMRGETYKNSLTWK